MNFRLARGAVILFSIVGRPALADHEMNVFGHRVEVVGPFNEQKLVVDGKDLIENARVFIDRIEVVGGIGVVIGGSWGGAAVCDSSPFIVSFSAGKLPKLEESIEECGMGNITVHSQDIEIVYSAQPNVPGRKWVWMLATGFKNIGPIAFQADKNLGWDTLRHQQLGFPIDLYKNSEVGIAIKELTGPNDQTFIAGLSGPSKGEFVGDTYFGTGCMAHNCPFVGSFVIADITSRKVFIAWKSEDKPFVVLPPVKDWPGPFRMRLKEWTQEFR